MLTERYSSNPIASNLWSKRYLEHVCFTYKRQRKRTLESTHLHWKVYTFIDIAFKHAFSPACHWLHMQKQEKKKTSHWSHLRLTCLDLSLENGAERKPIQNTTCACTHVHGYEALPTTTWLQKNAHKSCNKRTSAQDETKGNKGLPPFCGTFYQRKETACQYLLVWWFCRNEE